MPAGQLEKMAVYMDVILLAQQSRVWPFTGHVININVKMEPHFDCMDASGMCGLALLSPSWSGGALVLHEAGMVVNLDVLDFMLFKSGDQTHFNKSLLSRMLTQHHKRTTSVNPYAGAEMLE
jgi:hypothetical protein